MKILYITPGCFDKGGISRYNRYQIQVLKELFGEHNIRVLSLLGPDQHSFEGEYKVFWHGRGTGIKDKLAIAGKLVSSCITWRPTCIWVGHVNLSGLAKLVSKFVGAKTVLNVYGLEVWSKKRPDASWGLRKSDFVISDCYNTSDYLVNNKIRKQSDITVIWDCIDTDRFKPVDKVPDAVLRKYNIPDPSQNFVVLSLGRLAKPDAFYKGYERLLKVVIQLSADFPGLRLVFAGRGNFREDLERIVEENKIQDRVSFTGSVDEEDLAVVYQSCHVFSLITESGEGKGEGIPLTPLEAMACGKPVLVGDQDGSREAVFENKNGFVLDSNNFIQQKEVLARYLTEPDLLEAHSAASAKIAQQYFSYNRFREEVKLFIESKLTKVE